MINRLIADNQINQIFKIFDFDGNGKIEKKDFEFLSHKLAETRGWKVYGEEHDFYHKMYMKTWKRLSEHIQKQAIDLNRDGVIDLSEWNYYWTDRMIEVEPKKCAEEWVHLFFDLLDHDGDGEITIIEYSSFLENFDLGSLVLVAGVIFRTLDINKDGKISKNELIFKFETIIRNLKATF